MPITTARSEEIARNFGEWFLEERGSDKTRLTPHLYSVDIKDFLECVENQGNDLTEITDETVAKYFRDKSYAPGTIHRKLSSLNKFKRFSSSHPDISFRFNLRNVKQILNVPKTIEYQRPPIITEPDFQGIIEKMHEGKIRNSSSPLNRYQETRNIIIASLYFRTGARKNQVEELDEEHLLVQKSNGSARVDVLFQERSNSCYETRGLEARTFIAYPLLLERTKRHLGTSGKEKALLINRHGGRISNRSIRRDVLKDVYLTGDRALTPSELRRSYKARRLKEGATVEEVRLELGMKQTGAYL